MKKMLLSLMVFVLTCSAFAAEHNYACIKAKLEAYNSDYYYDLTPADIDNLLIAYSDIRMSKVQQVARECDPKSATFTEYVKTENTLTSVMTTKLVTTEPQGNLINLKTTKSTTWRSGSQFIDVKNIIINLGEENGRNAVVTVYELSASGMGAKTTKLSMDCFKREQEVRCELETKKSLLKLTITE